jgi:hypothetical protein
MATRWPVASVLATKTMPDALNGERKAGKVSRVATTDADLLSADLTLVRPS